MVGPLTVRLSVEIFGAEIHTVVRVVPIRLLIAGKFGVVEVFDCASMDVVAARGGVFVGCGVLLEVDVDSVFDVIGLTSNGTAEDFVGFHDFLELFGSSLFIGFTFMQTEIRVTDLRQFVVR